MVMIDETYIMRGVFYTKTEGRIVGKAASIKGSSWNIEMENGKVLDIEDIYLDRDKQIVAPKDEDLKKYWREEVVKLINKWRRKVDKLQSCENLDKVSTSYSMKIKMAKAYLFEYRMIYSKFFRPNSVKFIMDDRLPELDF